MCAIGGGASAKMNSHRRLSVAVVGLGWAATNIHLPALMASPRVRSVVGYDVDGAIGAGARHAFGIDLATSMAEAISRAEVVVVATPPSTHQDIALEAISGHRHVILEKPLAATRHDALRIVSAAQEHDRVALCCNTNRYRRDVMRLKNLVDEGHLGSLRFVRASWLRNGGIPGTPGALEAGVAWDLGHHLLDLSMWLTGWKDVVEVHINQLAVAPDVDRAAWYGQTDVVRRVRFDTATIDASFPDGALHAEVSWSSNVPSDRTEFLVLGSMGAARLSSVFGRSPDRELAKGAALSVSDPTTRRWRPVVVGHDPGRSEYARQLEYNLDLIERGGDWVSSLMPTVETVGLLELGGRSVR